MRTLLLCSFSIKSNLLALAEIKAWAGAFLPSLTKRILDAIPSRIEHLSLDTDCCLANDFAAYLLVRRGPRALRTLRIGDEVGQMLAGFCATIRATSRCARWRAGARTRRGDDGEGALQP